MVLVREDELSSKRRDDLDKLRMWTNRLIKCKNDIWTLNVTKVITLQLSEIKIVKSRVHPRYDMTFAVW